MAAKKAATKEPAKAKAGITAVMTGEVASGWEIYYAAGEPVIWKSGGTVSKRQPFARKVAFLFVFVPSLSW